MQQELSKKVFDENIKKRFFNTYKPSNHDINTFIIFFAKKSVYSYEYMDDLETFNDISLPEKEDLYGHLNMEDNTGVD